MIGRYLSWRNRRRRAHEARQLIREVARILRRFEHRVTPEVAREVRASVEELLRSLRDGKDEAIGVAAQQLDDQVGRHLSFGRKGRPREYVESIAVAVGLALLLRAFVVEAFKIPSGSMLPTLEIGDHLFVNKYLYGLRVPMTNLKFLEFREPRRGEVVVFVYPKEEDKDFIKRIVGIPGDTVEVRHMQVFLNGRAVPRQPVPGPCGYTDLQEGTGMWSEKRCVEFLEELDGIRYRTIHEPGGGFRQNFPATLVGPHSVFVMGDNRDNSHDSRYWGTVPYDHIKGKALFIWLSLGGPDEGGPDEGGPDDVGRPKSFMDYIFGPLGVRWQRFGRPVHSE